MSGRTYAQVQARQGLIAAMAVAILAGLLLTATGVNMLLAGAGVICDSSEPAGLKSILLSFLWRAGAALCKCSAGSPCATSTSTTASPESPTGRSRPPAARAWRPVRCGRFRPGRLHARVRES
jgi:hypothetical protein